MKGRLRAVLPAAAAVAGLFAIGPAGAQELPPDPVSIWTLQDEAALFGPLAQRYYTNGFRLGYVSGTDAVPGFLTGVGRAVWGDGQLRFGVDLTQQIYTPKDIAAPAWPPGDRPYAGVLLANFSLYRDVPDSRSALGLSIGLVGPGAFASQTQDAFHSLFNQTKANGWSSQLANEPLFQLTSARTWRLKMGSVGGLQTDALPNLGIGLGNLRIYADTGIGFRIGQGLDSDYGPVRMFPNPSGGTAFRPTRPFAWYLFLGADGQGVVRDITLDGNDFRSGPSVAPEPLVGEVTGGFGIIAFGTRISYIHAVQSAQFEHQKNGPIQLDSVAISTRF
ncbi:MAG: lipid A deacylase LpxR family protein [Alphaproteobacteria bacterium]|nr:lipid A deacylase LpxR family protein [Alphaproteobacteria bacterium]